MAAVPAEGQGETSLTRESFEVQPVPARTSSPHEQECPVRLWNLLELGVCPLERAEVLLREEDGAADPKANVLEVFCNRIPQEN